jgi:hypothetical protein
VEYLVPVADAVTAVLNDAGNQATWGATFTAERDWTAKQLLEEAPLNEYRVMVIPGEGSEAVAAQGALTAPTARVDVVVYRRTGNVKAAKDAAFAVCTKIKKTFAAMKVLAGAENASLTDIEWQLPSQQTVDSAGLFLAAIGLVFNWAEDVN